MDKKERKEALRQILLDRRSSISEEDFHIRSDAILSKLTKLSAFEQAGVIHCYISMNERREVNTHPLIKSMLIAGKKVVVPITQIDSGTLHHVELQSFDDLERNKWGVLEPVDYNEVLVEEFELVIVPMVGGDLQKNRIGYGKGFYDRFLANVDCFKVGLLFEACIIDEVPTEEFDVPLDALISEKQIY